MHAHLPRMVTTLTRPHMRTHEDTTGIEPPLLLLLDRAVIPSRGSSTGGYGQSSGSPMDLTASMLLSSIEREVCQGRWGTAAMPAHAVDTALATHLEAWASETYGTAEYARIMEVCERWVQQIQDLLDPPPRHPLRGMECPACTHRWTHIHQDGERLRTEALVARLNNEDSAPYIECLHCTAEWVGVQIHDLSAALNYSTVATARDRCP